MGMQGLPRSNECTVAVLLQIIVYAQKLAIGPATRIFSCQSSSHVTPREHVGLIFNILGLPVFGSITAQNANSKHHSFHIISLKP